MITWKTHGAKHSPSESALGGNNGKPGGPPLCVAWTPLDRLFSHLKSVPERMEAWERPIFGALSHGDLDFFMDRPETLTRGAFFDHLWCHYERKHENEAREAVKGQKYKIICENKTTCKFSSHSVD